MDADRVVEFVRAREAVLGRIGEAAARVGRDPAGVTLVAVSKTHPPEVVQAAIDAGLTELGENRVQEAVEKVAGTHGGRWHLIGPLQGNKARKAIEAVDVIQSVDSVELARRLDRIAGEVRPGERFPVLLQVNVADDPAKAGFGPDAVEASIGELLELRNLRVDGLMTIGRLVATAEAARPTFVALRELGERLRARHPGLGPALSMGMTDDFEIAVEEGATIVRVGRALFGARPTPAA
ncbi:MAG TPA: YggS family pyridoxal phosphate-dependent enzyme [Candidatus Limnocylindrales bacterium]|nr:YggS family pyridoxal phosphate-dependent enzyme [Candidatus Limnocylindrales bacterium]